MWLPLFYAALVAITAIASHLVPIRAWTAFLLLASSLSYLFLAPKYLPHLGVVVSISFVVGRRIAVAGQARRAWLWLGVGAQVALLAWVRVFTDAQPFTTPLAALGLSFVCLQAISYLFDIAAGRLQPVPATQLALYLIYFPKILAGPIERAHLFLPKLHRAIRVDDAVVARAGWLIWIGLFRKLFIADVLAGILPPLAFRDPDFKSAGMLAGAILGYGIVLYNDFAGYSGIARGVSLLFGIELTANFRQPFFATSFTDLWNRWHISLSLWLRDYVYFPLSRYLVRRNPSRRNAANIVLPPLVAMTVSGLWHGSGPHFLVWGLAHGLLLSLERAFLLWGGSSRAATAFASRWRSLPATLLVFAFTLWLLVPFRLDLDRTWIYWQRLLTFTPGEVDARLWGYLLTTFWLDWMHEKHGETPFDHWPDLARAAVVAALFVGMVLAARDGASAHFVYEGF